MTSWRALVCLLLLSLALSVVRGDSPDRGERDLHSHWSADSFYDSIQGAEDNNAHHDEGGRSGHSGNQDEDAGEDGDSNPRDHSSADERFQDSRHLHRHKKHEWDDSSQDEQARDIDDERMSLRFRDERGSSLLRRDESEHRREYGNDKHKNNDDLDDKFSHSRSLNVASQSSSSGQNRRLDMGAAPPPPMDSFSLSQSSDSSGSSASISSGGEAPPISGDMVPSVPVLMQGSETHIPASASQPLTSSQDISQASEMLRPPEAVPPLAPTPSLSLPSPFPVPLSLSPFLFPSSSPSLAPSLSLSLPRYSSSSPAPSVPPPSGPSPASDLPLSSSAFASDKSRNQSVTESRFVVHEHIGSGSPHVPSLFTDRVVPPVVLAPASNNSFAVLSGGNPVFENSSAADSPAVGLPIVILAPPPSPFGSLISLSLSIAPSSSFTLSPTQLAPSPFPTAKSVTTSPTLSLSSSARTLTPTTSSPTSQPSSSVSSYAPATLTPSNYGVNQKSSSLFEGTSNSAPQRQIIFARENSPLIEQKSPISVKSPRFASGFHGKLVRPQIEGRKNMHSSSVLQAFEIPQAAVEFNQQPVIEDELNLPPIPPLLPGFGLPHLPPLEPMLLAVRSVPKKHRHGHKSQRSLYPLPVGELSLLEQYEKATEKPVILPSFYSLPPFPELPPLPMPFASVQQKAETADSTVRNSRNRSPETLEPHASVRFKKRPVIESSSLDLPVLASFKLPSFPATPTVAKTTDSLELPSFKLPQNPSVLLELLTPDNSSSAAATAPEINSTIYSHVTSFIHPPPEVQPPIVTQALAPDPFSLVKEGKLKLPETMNTTTIRVLEQQKAAKAPPQMNDASKLEQQQKVTANVGDELSSLARTEPGKQQAQTTALPPKQQRSFTSTNAPSLQPTVQPSEQRDYRTQEQSPSFASKRYPVPINSSSSNSTSLSLRMNSVSKPPNHNDEQVRALLLETGSRNSKEKYKHMGTSKQLGRRAMSEETPTPSISSTARSFLSVPVSVQLQLVEKAIERTRNQKRGLEQLQRVGKMDKHTRLNLQTARQAKESGAKASMNAQSFLQETEDMRTGESNLDQKQRHSNEQQALILAKEMAEDGESAATAASVQQQEARLEKENAGSDMSLQSLRGVGRQRKHSEITDKGSPSVLARVVNTALLQMSKDDEHSSLPILSGPFQILQPDLTSSSPFPHTIATANSTIITTTTVTTTATSAPSPSTATTTTTTTTVNVKKESNPEHSEESKNPESETARFSKSFPSSASLLVPSFSSFSYSPRTQNASSSSSSLSLLPRSASTNNTLDNDIQEEEKARKEVHTCLATRCKDQYSLCVSRSLCKQALHCFEIVSGDNQLSGLLSSEEPNREGCNEDVLLAVQGESSWGKDIVVSLGYCQLSQNCFLASSSSYFPHFSSASSSALSSASSRNQIYGSSYVLQLALSSKPSPASLSSSSFLSPSASVSSHISSSAFSSTPSFISVSPRTSSNSLLFDDKNEHTSDQAMAFFQTMSQMEHKHWKQNMDPHSKNAHNLALKSSELAKIEAWVVNQQQAQAGSHTSPTTDTESTSLDCPSKCQKQCANASGNLKASSSTPEIALSRCHKQCALDCFVSRHT